MQFFSDTGFEDMEILQVPEYRQIYKAVLKYEIQTLLQKLSDTGEESVVLTASIHDDSATQLGSTHGKDFLQSQANLQGQFLCFCKDKLKGHGSKFPREIVSYQSAGQMGQSSRHPNMKQKQDATSKSAINRASECSEMKTADPCPGTSVTPPRPQLTLEGPICQQEKKDNSNKGREITPTEPVDTGTTEKDRAMGDFQTIIIKTELDSDQEISDNCNQEIESLVPSDKNNKQTNLGSPQKINESRLEGFSNIVHLKGPICETPGLGKESLQDCSLRSSFTSNKGFLKISADCQNHEMQDGHKITDRIIYKTQDGEFVAENMHGKNQASNLHTGNGRYLVADDIIVMQQDSRSDSGECIDIREEAEQDPNIMIKMEPEILMIDSSESNVWTEIGNLVLKTPDGQVSDKNPDVVSDFQKSNPLLSFRDQGLSYKKQLYKPGLKPSWKKKIRRANFESESKRQKSVAKSSKLHNQNLLKMRDASIPLDLLDTRNARGNISVPYPTHHQLESAVLLWQDKQSSASDNRNRIASNTAENAKTLASSRGTLSLGGCSDEHNTSETVVFDLSGNIIPMSKSSKSNAVFGGSLVGNAYQISPDRSLGAEEVSNRSSVKISGGKALLRVNPEHGGSFMTSPCSLPRGDNLLPRNNPILISQTTETIYKEAKLSGPPASNNSPLQTDFLPSDTDLSAKMDCSTELECTVVTDSDSDDSLPAAKKFSSSNDSADRLNLGLHNSFNKNVMSKFSIQSCSQSDTRIMTQVSSHAKQRDIDSLMSEATEHPGKSLKAGQPIMQRVPHESLEMYTCNVCQKVLLGKNEKAKHLKLHGDSRPYKCPVCPKRFIYPQDVKRHARIHTGEFPYKCQFCGKPFSDNGNYHKHVRRHLTKKDTIGMHSSILP